MPKGAIGVMGYWPDGVFRYLAVPGMTLEDGVMVRPSRRSGDVPALRTQEETVLFKELQPQTTSRAIQLRSVLGTEQHRLALLLEDPVEEVLFFLAAQKAKCDFMIIDPAAPDATKKDLLERFAPEKVLFDSPSHLEILEPWRDNCLMADDLLAEPPTSTKFTPPRREGKMYVAGDGDVLYEHTERTLLAGAISWGTYVNLQGGSVLKLGSLARWESLYCLLPTLFRGGSVLLGDMRDTDALWDLVQAQPHYTIVPWGTAHDLVEADIASQLRFVYLSVTGPFDARERIRFQNLLETPVLTVFGQPELGPVCADHHTWLLEESVGLPPTNVDLWPLNPDNGNPLDLSWEALEYAEIGMKSPMQAVGSQPPERWTEQLRGEWVRTHRICRMDPNGFYYLL